MPACTTTSPKDPDFWKPNCLTGEHTGLVAYAPYDIIPMSDQLANDGTKGGSFFQFFIP